MEKMEYKAPMTQPRLIIHGGAGNIRRQNLPPDKYQLYRSALLAVISQTKTYMQRHPHSSAIDMATYAVRLLEDDSLFNAGYGAVFTRDGINELEASVMVSRGQAKRAVGVMGLRHVRNPILLAREILERGGDDLRAGGGGAQGHSQLWGEAAEGLAREYGLDMVEQEYFFTQQRWDEHLRGLQGQDRDEAGKSSSYLPQGTVGAVALDADGVVCVATSTGGMTNKLTGRVGDTPTIGAGFWAEEWLEHGKTKTTTTTTPGVLENPLTALWADCLPALPTKTTTTTVVQRSMGVSGTGNGDSFLRTAAARSVAAMARWRSGPTSVSRAVTHVVGPGGELQRSAGRRWADSPWGEGQGGMIGIESHVERCAATGSLLSVSSDVVMDFNCGGMFRAWLDRHGQPRMSVWTNGGEDELHQLYQPGQLRP